MTLAKGKATKAFFICLMVATFAFSARAEFERLPPQLAGVVIINLGAIEREAKGEDVKESQSDEVTTITTGSVKPARKASRRKARRINKRAKRRKSSDWRSNILGN